ncbi:WD repeat-containing protein 43-like [Ruditapes philippinarum]|uniref:WD repeat-containing protein 43-like n=1 Tax=Ruditapes philippinarum TaxID=129788 RepID=UPI00295BA9DF|nr:WD repeat-containing protein 43-like [Ruditapes philippinarum]
MDTTPIEFSPKGEFAVHSSHDGVIKVWEIATNSLKNEYKPSSHLSATCTCLSWCPRSRENKQKKKRQRVSKTHLTSAIQELELVAIGTASGSILLYSVIKGDLHSQLVEGHSDRVNNVVWYPESDALYSCSSDQHIIEWEITSLKIKHKWKGDKGPVYSLCKCSNEHLLSAGRSIKLWDLKTKQELKRFTGHATEVFKLLHVPTSPDSLENSYFLSAAANDRLVNAWQINTSSTDKNALAAFSMPDEPVDMMISSHSKPLVLVVVTECGKALLYEHKLNGKLKQPLKPKVTIQIASEVNKTSIPKPIQILAAYVCDESKHKLLLVHGNNLKPTFEKVTCSMSEPDMCLIREDSMSVRARKESNVTKVKTPEVSKDLTVLVPGQMTPIPPTQEQTGNRRKRKASVGEMTLEQRLNAVSLEKPKSRDGKHPPRADTLVTLLVQGLQSQDRKLLNQVLQKTDVKLIQNTVRKLPVQMVIPLVQELTKRMHGHAQSGISQVVWIQTVLAVHTSYLMTFPEIVETFSGLYQMMDSRVTMLGKLSRLKGKLDIMLSQISAQTQAQGEEPGASQPALLQFEEDSSDEDLEDIAIGPPVSDSEENWEDFSDEESDMDMQDEINGKG